MLRPSVTFVDLRVPSVAGSRPDDGVPDMTVISDIDEAGINRTLHVRYDHDRIYVSFIRPDVTMPRGAEDARTCTVHDTVLICGCGLWMCLEGR